MDQNRGQLIVALDVGTFKEAKRLVDSLSEFVDIFKVGSQLFTACGTEIVHYLFSKEKKIFLDLKFHDIPNTVANAMKAVVGLNASGQGIFMCTLHIVGGKEMLRQAVLAATKTAQDKKVTKPLLVGITVLTSEEKDDNIIDLVLERAKLAKECGLDGIVASSQEAQSIRRELGPDFIVVTPGIRPLGKDAGDQKRVATPAQAVLNGSNFLVVGRPIIEARNPQKAAQEILEEIKKN